MKIQMLDGGEVDVPANGCIDAGQMLFVRIDGTVTGHQDGKSPAIGIAVESSGPLEPSAVERLAAIEDPEIKKRVDAWDRRNTLHLAPFDPVPDPSAPGAVPLLKDALRSS